MNPVVGEPISHEPEADTVKLFVGQVPRDFNEDDIRPFLEEFGEIYQLHVLRDKETKLSKGCCFVTYMKREASLRAQSTLHNTRTLPNMNHPMQVKPADTEKKAPIEERKLFVGMVSKKMNENEVRDLFADYGPIEECTILRDENKNSKGCAFVTFSHKSSAIDAINQMNGARKMDGCSGPLVVKLADTQRDKQDPRKMAPPYVQGNDFSGAGMAGRHTLGTQLLSWLQQAAMSGHVGPLGSMTLSEFFMAVHTLSPSNSSGMSSYIMQLLINLFSQQQDGGDHDGAGLLQPNVMGQNVAAIAHLAANMPQGMGLDLGPSGPTIMQSDMPYGPPFQPLPGGPLSSFAVPFPSGPSSPGSPAGKQTEGPDGANLFIYHLPPEFNDGQLASLFDRFGNVLSAKVFIDKQTSLSKCFGFVSFDRPNAASNAIAEMNGYAISNKRLKVQLKRPKSDRLDQSY